MKLKNKVAIITGGSRGIGFATAEKFLEEGAVVILTASSQASADKAVEKLQGRYPHATVAGTAPDLSSLESVRAAFQQVFDRFGGVDILVNNAGIWRCWASFLETSIGDWKQFIDVNVMGTVYFTKAVLPGMLDRGWGRIVNVASVAGVYGNANMVHYSATKGAILSMTKALAKEVADRGVTVNSISPGMVNSSKDPDIDATIPNGASYVGRTGSARENAELICFLASEKAAFISGQNVQIDGCRKNI